MMDWPKACEVISRADSIVLTTHCNPDGDGIGSELALYHALKEAGKKVYIHNRDGVPRIYRFLPGSDAVSRGNEFSHQDVDLILSLDAGARSRLGLDGAFFEGRTLLNIDHHPSNEMFGDINLVDVGACATGAMVEELIRRLGLILTPAAAEAVYGTVLTDTFCFRNTHTSAGVFELAARLARAGARPEHIAREVYESHRRATFDLLHFCLATLEIHDRGRSAWLHVDQKMYRQSGSDAEDTEGFIEYGRSLQGIEVAVFIRPESTGGWKVSFRGKLDVDVGALAVSLGGGGHRYAAGCSLPGAFDEVRGRVRRAVSELLNRTTGECH